MDCDFDICRFCIYEYKFFKYGVGREVMIMCIEIGNIVLFMVLEKGCEVYLGEIL